MKKQEFFGIYFNIKCGIIFAMDRERKKRIQTIKLIITEIIMVITVVAAVIILTFVAMGYNINKNGDLAQSGLLQVRSIPTGATVTIDDETIVAKTNMSRMLSAGQHFLKLTKNGYDTWTKKINSEPGWLLKLDYPRLFLQNRTIEKVREYDNNIQTISYDGEGEQILYKLEKEDKWILLNIAGDDVSETKYDLSKYLEKNEVKELFWDDNNDKVLMHTRNNDKNEWILIHLRNIENSINISKEFSLNIAKAGFMTDSGDRLIVLENGNLRTISVSEKTMSQVLAKNVEDFSYNNDAIAYVAGIIPTSEIIEKTNNKTRSEKDFSADRLMRAIMMYTGNSADTFIMELAPDTPIKLALSDYLGKDYLAIAENNNLRIYRGTYPKGDESLLDMEQVLDGELKAAPNELKVWTEGELIMAKNGKDIAMFDAELSKLSEYEIEGENVFFPEKYMLGVVAGSKLIVRDFDGENRRELTTAEGSGGVISKNDKWLYYSLVVENKTNIFREKIVD